MRHDSISKEGGNLLLSGVLYNDFSAAIIPWLHGAVVKDLTSLIGDLKGASSNPNEVILLNFVHFFAFLVF